jgi:uncharacterized radical SAM superfamily protein
MKEIKRELNPTLLVHSGLVRKEIAEGLADVGVDCVMIDIIGDDETISQVCHLTASVEDFDRSLQLLTSFGVPTAPHVIMGLHFGEVRGERRAFEIIARYPVKALVLVGFRPIPGTPMADVQPLFPQVVGELFASARKRFPRLPVLLGCERPLGPYREETDLLALEAGLDGIAFPSESAIRWAEEHDIQPRFSRTCCSMIPGLDT